MKQITSVICLAMLLLGTEVSAQANKSGTPAPAADTTKKAPAKPGVAEKVKSSKKHSGLFTVYQDTVTGTVQMYVRKDQLNKEFIYQSFSLSGPTTLYLNQSMHRSTLVFKMKRSFDKIEFSLVNTNFFYDPNNAVSKAANVDVADAVFFTDKFSIEDSTGYLISVDQLFLSDKLDPVKPIFPPTVPSYLFFNLGGYNPSKSKVSGVRSYPNNTDVIVDLAYDNPVPYNQGGKDVTDARYVRVKLQHSFLEMPNNDYRPRRDDPRIGYFSQEIDDMTSNSYTPYKDVINRWHLKKKDPNAALSEPVEPIVYWVENTTPVEYRQIVFDAGMKWNEAFEKAGFKNAVQMKMMPDDATWDPADIRYNVIRWVSSPYPSYGAIGPSFVNPKTGQILGADITIEWKPVALFPGDAVYTDRMASITGPQEATDELFNKLLPQNQYNHWKQCNIGKYAMQQFASGFTMMQLAGASPEDEKEFNRQFMFYLVLHEMGHTLGLNHNMKASSILSPAEVNNKSITSKIGLMGSVMDYPSVNVTSDKSKQGDYYTTKVGPYDSWAIEYGYSEFSPAEEDAKLNAIASRSNEPYLAFGNDADDMRSPGNGIDPRVMVNDMSNDMVAYAEDRYKFVNATIPRLVTKFGKEGESYAGIRGRYNLLNFERRSMSQAVANYIGGVYVDRSFIGQNKGSKPFTVVPVAYQKKAMDLLTRYIFAPNAFDTDAQLFQYLQFQRRGYNFFGNTEDPKLQNIILGIQITALQSILNSTTLSRINNSGLYGNTYSVADVMSDLASGIFKADLGGAVNLYRQNLQMEFVKGAIAIVEAKTGYDNATKSAAYNTLRKIKGMLATAVSPNEQTRAHRSMVLFLIDKALSVK
ncbi:MAG: zinc-dependent metalloprotease [Chitinophagaceae bacterium]